MICTPTQGDSTMVCTHSPVQVDTVPGDTVVVPGDTIFDWPPVALETFVGDSSSSEFSFGQKGGNDTFMWQIAFNGTDQPDLEPRVDSVFGSYRWVSGDRIAYHSGYTYLAHQDPGQHGYLLAFRFFFQISDDSHSLRDSGMRELRPQGELPYPYERDFPVEGVPGEPVQKIAFFHQRECPGGRSECAQLIAEYYLPQPGDTMPSGQIQELSWENQGAGFIAGIHPVLGEVTKFIVSSQHPKYRFAVCPAFGNQNRRYVDGTERPLCSP